MKSNHLLIRKQIDKRLKRFKTKDFIRPIGGWIREIRSSLGMSTAQLAKRVSVSQPRITALEKGEVKNRLTLRTLEKVAYALNCEFVYAFIPNQSLEEMVLTQAQALAAKRLNSVKQTMELENQTVSKEINSIFFKELVGEILRKESRHLWD